MQRQIGDVRRQGLVLGNLGLDHAALADWERAIEYYDNRSRSAGKSENGALRQACHETWAWPTRPPVMTSGPQN